MALIAGAWWMGQGVGSSACLAGVYGLCVAAMIEALGCHRGKWRLGGVAMLMGLYGVCGVFLALWLADRWMGEGKVHPVRWRGLKRLQPE